VEPRQRHVRPQGRRATSYRRGLRPVGSPRHPGRLLRDLDRAPPEIGADQRDQRASNWPPCRRGGRRHRVEGLAAA
jgi:hypothetical protein